MKKLISLLMLTVMVSTVLLLPGSGCKKESEDPANTEDTLVFLSRGDLPTWSPLGDYIAFMKNDSLYIIHPDGSGAKLLTSGVHGPAAWSHSGQSLAFLKPSMSGYDICTINVDGSSLTNLTNSSVFASVPSWSPDDQKIAFISTGNTGDLYLMNANGTGQQKLTTLQNCSPWDSPQWCMDGTKILFSAGYDSDRDLYLVHPDGSNLQRLNYTEAWEEDGQFTPDGSSIIFAGNTQVGFFIYSCHVDGTNYVKLNNESTSNNFPFLSPDGNWIAYNSYRPAGAGLYVMRIDGSGDRLVLKDYYGDVDWSPDSKRLACAVFSEGVTNIYSLQINAD